MRVCITTKLFKFCSCCCEEQKIGLSLLKLHEFMDPFITLSKLCHIVADLEKFKGIQLLLINFLFTSDPFQCRCLGKEVWPGHSDPDPI